MKATLMSILKKISALMAALVVASTAVANNGPQNEVVNHPEAQAKWNQYLNQITNLLQKKLPNGCKLIRISEGREIGLGENYKGDSLVFVLDINGREVKFWMPKMNAADNESSHIEFNFISSNFDKLFDPYLQLVRNHYTTEKLGFFDPRKNSTYGYVGSEYLVLFLNNQQDGIGNISYYTSPSSPYAPVQDEVSCMEQKPHSHEINY